MRIYLVTIIEQAFDLLAQAYGNNIGMAPEAVKAEFIGLAYKERIEVGSVDEEAHGPPPRDLVREHLDDIGSLIRQWREDDTASTADTLETIEETIDRLREPRHEH